MIKQIKSDLIIIGGGLIGSAAAYFLSKQKIPVILLEKGGVASGTSGACSGKIWFSTKKPGIHLKLAMESSELYKKLLEEITYPVERYKDGEMLFIETEDQLRFMEDFVEAQRQIGIDIRLLTQAEIKEMQPAVDLRRIMGASFSPMGMAINPMEMVFAFIEEAKKLGARILRNTDVVGIKTRGSKIHAILTNKGEIETPCVVNAAGVYAPHIGAMVNLHIPVTPVRGQILVTEPVAPTIPVPTLEVSYLAFKRNPDISKLHAGAEITSGLSQSPKGNVYITASKESAGFSTETSADAMAALASRALDFFPTLAPLRVIRSYSGLRPFTSDGLPIIGKVEGLEGMILAAGHGGDGVTLAPITGKLIAELITTGKTTMDISELSLLRFNSEARETRGH